MIKIHSISSGIALLFAMGGCSSDAEHVLPIEQGLCQNDPNDPCCPGSPIIIDIDGDGFDLTDLAGGVRFKLNPAGNAQLISWTAPSSDDAWLALDRNANGVIDDGSELFGNFTPQPSSRRPQGYLALAVFDLNDDNVVDSRDTIFSDLRLWQDRNHDGVSDPGEFSRLESHGIVGLDIAFIGVRKMDEHGNLFRYRANVLRTSDSRVGPLSYDVFLITHTLDSQAREQGAYQDNGAVSLAVIDPDPSCPGEVCFGEPCYNDSECDGDLCGPTCSNNNIPTIPGRCIDVMRPF